MAAAKEGIRYGGRKPTVFNAENRAALLAALEKGLTRKAAAALCGVNEQSFEKWTKRGRKELECRGHLPDDLADYALSPYEEFTLDVLKAEQSLPARTLAKATRDYLGYNRLNKTTGEVEHIEGDAKNVTGFLMVTERLTEGLRRKPLQVEVQTERKIVVETVSGAAWQGTDELVLDKGDGSGQKVIEGSFLELEGQT